jgi:hypothetical protein
LERDIDISLFKAAKDVNVVDAQIARIRLCSVWNASAVATVSEIIPQILPVRLRPEPCTHSLVSR